MCAHMPSWVCVCVCVCVCMHAYACVCACMYVCVCIPYTAWNKTLTVEKSDEFNDWMLNRQNFPYQNFALKNFRYCIRILRL